jgi:tetratricopeptide (TPR) repeat protein
MNENSDVESETTQYRQAIQEDPEDQISHYLLAGALREKRELDGAIAEFREAIRIAPIDWAAHLALALALDEKCDLDGAVTEWRELLRHHQADANLRSLFADALAKRAGSLTEEGNLLAAILDYREMAQDAHAHSSRRPALPHRWDC